MGLAVVSSLQRRAAVKVPWRLSVLLLLIFAAAWPFDPSYSGGGHITDQTVDAMSQAIENGGVERPIALFSLGLFAFVTLLSKKRSRLRVNGPLGWSLLFYLFLACASPARAEDSSLTIRRVGILVLLSLGAMAVAARLSQIRTASLAVCV